LPYGIVLARWPAGVARHPVDEVVEDEHGDVDVPAAGVDEVVPADRRRVAVAADHQDVLVRLRHLQAGGERERAAMRRVEGVEVHVAGEARGATDPGHHGDVVTVELQCVDDAQDRLEDDPVGAPRAPDVRQFPAADVLIVVERHAT